jgi:hypothetical protein
MIPRNLHWSALTILAGFATAWGQGDGYSAPALEHGPPWQAIVCAVAGLVAICAIAFKNARRTHLD